MSTFLIATIKSWNIENALALQDRFREHRFILVTEREQLTCDFLQQLSPRYIFFPHWSWIIPEEIYNNYDCVVFHMTDLPFGRGGSPLQNLLLRGIYQTKVSAIKVSAGIDAGSIYCKEPLDISTGSADDILKKVSDIVFDTMIPKFLEDDMLPVEQTGEIVLFRRRAPEQSEIPNGLSSRQLYDFIRMLDGEGYPSAYTRCADGKILYRNARLIGDTVLADAEFRRD